MGENFVMVGWLVGWLEGNEHSSGECVIFFPSCNTFQESLVKRGAVHCDAKR